jgi:hypothetical protein
VCSSVLCIGVILVVMMGVSTLSLRSRGMSVTPTNIFGDVWSWISRALMWFLAEFLINTVIGMIFGNNNNRRRF